MHSRLLRYYGPPIATLVVLVAVALLQREVGPRWDLHRVPAGGSFAYVGMAETPFWNAAKPYETPYSWRILGPVLVHFCPCAPSTGFFWLGVFSLAGTAAAMVWLLLGLGLPERSAAGGGIAFVLLGAGAAYNLNHYNLIDPLAFFLLTLVLASVAHRRGPLVVVSLVLLAAAKETVVIGLVSAIVWVACTRDRRMQYWVGAGAALSLLLLMAIRSGMPASPPYSLFHEFSSIYTPIPPYKDLARILIGATGLTWGVLLPLASLQLVHAPRMWRRFPGLAILLCLATAQILVAWDTERVVIVGFAAVIAATAFEIEFLASRTGLRAVYLWGATSIGELPWLAGSLDARGVPFLGWASYALVILAVCLTTGAFATAHRQPQLTPLL